MLQPKALYLVTYSVGRVRCVVSQQLMVCPPLEANFGKFLGRWVGGGGLLVAVQGFLRVGAEKIPNATNFTDVLFVVSLKCETKPLSYQLLHRCLV